MKDRRRASRESVAWTLAFGQPEERTPTHGRGEPRGRDGGVREELAAGVKGVDRPAVTSIQNISGLPQGFTQPFGGRLSGGAPCVLFLKQFATPRRSTMSEQAVEERRGWASDIVWVLLYSIVVLLVMLLWVYVPA